MKLFIPKNYESILDPVQTEMAIKQVKDFFQENLMAELRLRRVTAPLFVLRGTGLNDDLNGVERAVSFPINDMDDQVAEVVHSLAKWKRMMLAKLGIEQGYGLYTDMNAIRADEELTNIHSLYVDQWDWELVVSKEQRNIEFLKGIVKRIFQVLKRTEFLIYENYRSIAPMLPEDITFIQSEELLKLYPTLSPRDRENEIAKKHGAVFILGIGGKLSNGEEHDGRAPDYDDWTTESDEGYMGLNGDLILWNSLLERSFEVSSMGIRVDRDALLKQLALTGTEDRKNLMFHKALLNNEVPLTIGGGIGQSRIAMFFLRKVHIGEVQASIWPTEMMRKCAENNVFLM